MDTSEKSITVVDYNKDIDILRNTICKDLNDRELEMFIGVCNRKQLDPISRQIYAIKTGGRMQPITSIDGFRLIAERTGLYDGQDSPMWFKEDGTRTNIWLDDQPPAAAMVKVYKKGCSKGFVGIARWSSFGGNSPTWKKMPDHMLAKVAESHALRKAFPQEISGLYTDDEMDQVPEKVLPVEPTPVEPTPPQYHQQQPQAPQTAYQQQRAQQNYNNIYPGQVIEVNHGQS